MRTRRVDIMGAAEWYLIGSSQRNVLLRREIRVKNKTNRGHTASGKSEPLFLQFVAQNSFSWPSRGAIRLFSSPRKVLKLGFETARADAAERARGQAETDSHRWPAIDEKSYHMPRHF